MEYFELRGVSANTYVGSTLPLWLADQIEGASRSATFLDYGCGFGQNLKALQDLGFFNVFGADINSFAIEHCRDAELKVFDVSDGFDQLEMGNHRFDFIITTHVLEHVPKSQVVNLVSKLRSLLNPGGVLLVAVPNGQAFTGCYWAYEDFTHHTLYTAGSLRFVLRAAGFSNIELLDRHACHKSGFLRQFVRRSLAQIYDLNYRLWKRVLASPTHDGSEDVFTYELKMKASR